MSTHQDIPDERSADAPAPLLQASDVRKTYPNGVTALDGVDLAVGRGEVVVVVGPSGCGKSTLLRTLNGLEEIQGGTITLDGTQLGSRQLPWTAARQRIGMVFQSYELFGHLSVMDNLLLGPLTVQKANRPEAARRAAQLLKRVGLLDRADAFPRQLSGGQKQRVAIIRALMMQPEVLLLDEVTASLDPEMVREVLDVVAELARDGMTMVIVTHEMGFARSIADRIVFMDHGKVVEQDSPLGFFTAPKTERARQFLNIFEYEI
ncbi:amino acid ABC transporter ATP-binding protein [Luteococcus sp.]|uniref:amino acid ABC transporter ATP-binding protein n=1 Tax=Luteococcus sp. TaxID=1969402 RepID=UPI0037353A5A